MKRKNVWFKVMAFFVIGILFSLWADVTVAWAKSIELKVATATSETAAYYVGVKQALDSIAARSNGRVKFAYFPRKTLVKARSTYDAVVKGVCDISIVQPAYFPGRFPLTDVVSIEPAFVSNTEAGKNWLFIKENLLHEWSEVKVLCLNAKGSDVMMMAKKPVRTPDDLRGKRMFAIGITAKYMAAFKATPIRMSPLELYESLQKRIVDGACIGGMAAKTIKLAEVCKYVTVPGFGNIFSFTIMRKKSYELLPPDIKRLFDDLENTVPPAIGKLSDEQMEKAYRYFKDQGGEIIYLTPQERSAFLKIAMEVNEEWAKGLEAKGLPGRMILEKRYRFMKKYMPDVFPK